MRCSLLILILFLFPLATAITGETITGEASSLPTNVSVFVQPGPPVIYIRSPENKTYTQTDILFNYSITNNLSQAWYNIDNSNNASLGNSTKNNFTLNLSLGFHTLYFYANNSLGNSSKQVSFTLEEEPPPQVENNDNGGGGGGGGGGGSGFSSGILIEPETLEVTLLQGESENKSIEIKNKLDQNVQLKIEITDINNYLKLSQNSLILAPQQTQTILTTFSISPYTIPDVYIGKILIQYGSFQKIINAIINVKEKNALFDLNLNLSKNSFFPGEQIPVSAKIFNIKSQDQIEVNLYFYITDLDKNTVYEFPSENVIVKENQTVYKTLFLPDDFGEGNYLLLGEIKYENSSAFSYETFSVGKKSLSFLRFVDRLNKGDYNLYMVIIFAIVAGIVFYLIRKIHREKIE